MRLWHINLIPFLPRSQLLAQWRELNSIYKKQDNHILINYCYDYPQEFLLFYSDMLIDEFIKRGYKIRNYDNYDNYFNDDTPQIQCVFQTHDDTYLKICYWNLHEKFIRGQHDFNRHDFESLQNYCKSIIKDWRPI